MMDANNLPEICSFLAEAAGDDSIRIFPIIGDYMEPTLRPGDALAVLPTETWEGEGVYILTDPWRGAYASRISHGPKSGTLTIAYDNKKYSGSTVPHQYFLDNVLGKAVVALNVWDTRNFITNNGE